MLNPNGTAEIGLSAPNPFNPAALRLDQSFADHVGVKKLLTTVPVRKPNRQDFVRVHPDPAYRLTPAALIELKEDREVFLVTPAMAAELPGEFMAAALYTAINRQGVLQLWPVKLPGPDGKHNDWHRSAAEAAELAMHKWVRVTANMALGAYEIFEATGDLPEPIWPDLAFPDILKIAFRDRIVEQPRPPRGATAARRGVTEFGARAGAMLDALPFAEIWAADFEFRAEPGENPEPICLVARELRPGRTIRVWQDELRQMVRPPYPTGPDALFVAYYASAELGCHLALGWPVPERVLDLFTEFRNHTNGIPTGYGAGLLGALAFHGLDGIGAVEKDAMRALALRGGPYSGAERSALLEYCQSDVDALARLLPAMLPHLDLPRALLRGRYMAAAAAMERAGVPIDTEMLARLRRHWVDIQDRLIADIDASYGVFEGRTFKADRFAAWLARTGIPWPRLASGRLDLERRRLSRDGAGPPRSRPTAGAALRPVAVAAVRPGRGAGRPQSLPAVGVPGAHRSESAEQQQVHLRPERLAAWADPTAGGARPGLRRLVATGVRHRRGAVRRPADDGTPTARAIPISPSPSRPAPRRRTPPRRRTRRSASNSRPACWPSSTGWRRTRWRCASASCRSRRGPCCGCIGKPTGCSGHGRTGRSTTPC